MDTVTFEADADGEGFVLPFHGFFKVTALGSGDRELFGVVRVLLIEKLAAASRHHRAAHLRGSLAKATSRALS